MSTRYWLIRGWNSSETFFEMKVEVGQFTENQIKHVLMALAAKAGLNYNEIVGAYATRRTKIANNLLAVHKDSQYPTLMCGTNPHFAASVIDQDGKITRHRRLS